MPAHATKIEYRAAGSGSFASVLADEGDPAAGGLASRITGLCPKLRMSPQIEHGYGAASVSVFDRGNQQWDLSFTIERVHTDESAAAIFLANHPADFCAQGNLDLKLTTTGGITYMAACAVTEFTPDPHSDQSTRIRYAFVGGSYTTNEP